jgi:putative transposase
MTSNLALRSRRSPRLKGWDYSRSEKYHVTIVTKFNVCWFGEVVDDEMQYSALGEIAKNVWLQIAQHHEHVELDEFIVMPNHVHGILILGAKPAATDVQLNVRTVRARNPYVEYPANALTASGRYFSAISPKKDSLSAAIRTYKAAVTTWARENGFGDFGWHGRFHDHIIRNEQDYRRIVDYIRSNPRQWRDRKSVV